MFYKTLLAALMLVFSSQASAQSSYHVGIGLGVEYAGLGITGERVTDTSRLALGGGLVASSSWDGNHYGASLTYHRFDLIQPESGQHSIGVGVVPVGSHSLATYEVSGSGSIVLTNIERRVTYGGYVGYNFHPRRAALGGMQIGLGYVYGRRDGVTHDGLAINFGYRFN